MAAPTLVFLHGRGQEFKKPDQLLRKWLAALNAGLTAAGADPLSADRVVLPFYGNVLYQVTAASAGRALKLESTRPTDEPAPFSPATAPETGALERELLVDMARAAGMAVPDPDEPPPPVGRTGGGGRLREEGFRDRILSWGPAREILVSLAKRSRVDQLVITAHLRDVAIYLSDGREEVLEVVRKAVPAEGPLLLVSHSLGTVVARDLLHDDDVRERTTLWVTMGSPLGLEAVQKNLIDPSHRHPGVEWLTAYDVNDVVALGHPLVKSWGAPLTDLEVENDTDPHAVSRYLAHGDVAGPIGIAAARSH
ncbi:hypothetical protein [Modestobacter marinus]|uniref:hypothetical protein n=1 Tax=Modestobacter marinus TaxID=477641 RepID=UPI001C93F4D4|nr:hypothetical protein [Modestobacter marinus]